MKHRNTERLSSIGKQIIESCPNAYVDEYGQVIDPCHMWWSDGTSNPTTWIEEKD